MIYWPNKYLVAIEIFCAVFSWQILPIRSYFSDVVIWLCMHFMPFSGISIWYFTFFSFSFFLFLFIRVQKIELFQSLLLHYMLGILIFYIFIFLCTNRANSSDFTWHHQFWVSFISTIGRCQPHFLHLPSTSICIYLYIHTHLYGMYHTYLLTKSELTVVVVESLWFTASTQLVEERISF